jgi:hypothetical protein
MEIEHLRGSGTVDWEGFEADMEALARLNGIAAPAPDDWPEQTKESDPGDCRKTD